MTRESNYHRTFKSWKHAVREIAKQSAKYPNLKQRELADKMGICESDMSEFTTIMSYFDKPEIQNCKTKRSAYIKCLHIRREQRNFELLRLLGEPVDEVYP